jgi:hypothetical protein
MNDVSRQLWVRIETIHAVTYFGHETQDATRRLGVDGFWRGYFGLRAGPMGAVSSGVVQATFANFAPSFVDRWVPQVWAAASPETFVSVRAGAAALTLRRVGTSTGIDSAVGVNDVLAGAVADGVGSGRPLFAANQHVPPPDDPLEALWQWCTALREHRGDGHVAALTAAGIDGVEAHVLIAAETGADAADLQRTRGWSPDDWQQAVGRVVDRGWMLSDGVLADPGRAVRQSVEHTTDVLAAQPWSHLAPDVVEHVLQSLTPLATAVAASGVIRYPNPIGLPQLR